jgi:hypothetical protein
LPPREFSIGSFPSQRQETLLRDRLLTLAVFAIESFHAPGGIHQLLLPSKKGVALGANLQANLTSLRRTSLEGLATSADNVHFHVFGMNLFFHEPILNLNAPDCGVEKQAIIGAGLQAGKVKSAKRLGNTLYSEAPAIDPVFP